MSSVLRSLVAGGGSLALPMDIVRRIMPDEVSTISQAEALRNVMQAFPVRYGTLAAVTIVAWDWVTNLSDEVEFIWLRASGMSGRPLYCFIRYAGFAYQVYDLITQFGVWEHVAYCKAYFALLPIGTLAFLYAADVLLAYRALCLWRMKRTLVIFNVIVFSLSVLSSAIFAAYSISQYNVVPTPKVFTGCWASVPDWNFIAPVPGLLFEFWVFLLVLFRAFSFSRKDGLKMSKLNVVRMLFNDSMWWFSMITLLLIVNTLFLALAPANLSVFFIPIFRSFVIIFGCHLVLRMRRAAAGTNSRLPTAIEMDTWQQHQQHAPQKQQHHRTAEANSRTKLRIKCPYCRKIAEFGPGSGGGGGHQHAKSSLSTASLWDGRSISTSPGMTEHLKRDDEEDEDARVQFDVSYVVGDDDEEEEDVGSRRIGRGRGPGMVMLGFRTGMFRAVPHHQAVSHLVVRPNDLTIGSDPPARDLGYTPVLRNDEEVIGAAVAPKAEACVSSLATSIGGGRKNMTLDFTLDAGKYLSVAENTDVTRFCTLAAVVALFWDWATNFDDEVEYIWKRDWRMAGKPLYLIIRYLGFCLQIFDLVQMLGSWSEKVRHYYLLSWANTQQPLVFLLVLCRILCPHPNRNAVDVILAYRTLCLYRLNRRLVMVNVTFFGLAVASTAAIVGYSFTQFSVVATPRFITGCWATMPPTIYMTTVPPLIFELWLFSLVIYKLVRYTREVGKLSKQSILQLLVKDSMNWFFIIAAMILWNALDLSLAPEGLRGIALPLFRTLIVVGGCRLVIHMRQQMYKTAPAYDTAASAVQFASHGAGRDPASFDSDLRHKQRVIRVAQQIGLPPASTRLVSMWPDSQTDESMDIPMRDMDEDNPRDGEE
ncbi:hypothetical protein FRB90_003530, partial [Tulasnella sp. 427]